MPRTTPIRLTANDKTEYARLARNTKAKIGRTSKNYGVDLSNTIEVPELTDFTTRKEFNKWKEKVTSFTNRNNLNYQYKKNRHGVVATKKEISEVERENKMIQRTTKAMLEKSKNKPFISGGKVQGTKGQRMLQMGKPDVMGVYVPEDFVWEEVTSRSQLKGRKQVLEKRMDKKFYPERQVRMKENFITLLNLSFNSDAEELIELLKHVPPDDFYELYDTFDEFDFDQYDSDQKEPTDGKKGEPRNANQISTMLGYVQDYLKNGLPENNLKGFA